MMSILEWCGEHWFLTLVFLLLVFGLLERIVSAVRMDKFTVVHKTIEKKQCPRCKVSGEDASCSKDR